MFEQEDTNPVALDWEIVNEGRHFQSFSGFSFTVSLHTGATAMAKAEEEPALVGDPHPDVWDLICVGTGLTESLIAGYVAP